MPQQLLIANILPVSSILQILTELKDLLNLQLVSSMGIRMRIFHILHQQFISVAVLVKRSDVGVEFEVVGVQLVHVATDLALIE